MIRSYQFQRRQESREKGTQSLLSTNNTQDIDLNLNRSIQYKCTKWPDKKIKIVQLDKNN